VKMQQQPENAMATMKCNIIAVQQKVGHAYQGRWSVGGYVAGTPQPGRLTH